MKTLWDKGTVVDDQIATFTVGDDRTVDVAFAYHDVIGSMAHVLTLHKANLLSQHDAHILGQELLILKERAQKNDLKPSLIDEDIHSTLERILTDQTGDVGKRIHTARSRNDQIATDVALWMRQYTLEVAHLVIESVRVLIELAEREKDTLLVGMTHLQPAMPSSIGAWALGYATLLLDDFNHVQSAYHQAQACPLGSAAGYGVPVDLAPLDRAYTATLLGFTRPLEPVTAVQGGRGKGEASFLFAAAQLANTCARFARDVVLYVNPHFNFLKLPTAFTTGSSIMPQKRNPDVMELIRGVAPVVQAALLEVLSLSSSLPSGYHRDFQRLKAPLLRGIDLTTQALAMIVHSVPHLQVNHQALDQGCPKEIDATRRALQLVVDGMPFRDAYKQVADEVFSNTLPSIDGPRIPPLDEAFKQIHRRLNQAIDILDKQKQHQQHSLDLLLNEISALSALPALP
jgi:argininosuccinate lyase